MIGRGTIGVWSGELRFLRDRGEARDAMAELDDLGFPAIWIPGGPAPGDGLIDVVEEALEATAQAVIATGILSIWSLAPDRLAARARDLGPRALIGLGASHPELVSEELKPLVGKPLTAMRRYLDDLDFAGSPERSRRVLAALGPKMLDLAGERTAGAHPYLVSPAHTASAREALGPELLLAPEQAVVFSTDPEEARAAARAHLEVYLGLPNYTRNMMREGLSKSDLTGGGSDRLVDMMVAWGDEEAIAERVRAHHEAGADHVAIQVLGAERGSLPREQWRRLSALLDARG